MEINLPRLVNAAIPDRKKEGRNAIILSSNMGPNHNEEGFLSDSFPRSPAKLFVTAETDDFDEQTLREWREEGFIVNYLPFGGSTAEYKANLATLHSQAGLGPCETYGIIAYGDAASVCLEHFHVLDNNPEFKLCCLVAYYPTRIPDTRAQFPGGLRVLVHLAAGSEVGVVGHGQIVGLQGKRRVTKRNVERGLGAGGLGRYAYPSYTYDAEPGFAEYDLDEYERVSADLAWTRSLATVRKAFRRDVDLEMAVERNISSKFYNRNLAQTMATYTTHKSPHATYFPTLTGGIGAQELQRFYAQYFLVANPPSMKLTLLSRTVGTDRVVDELHVAFRHTQEMPWILPGVPPTNRRVEIVLVSIVTLRGGKLCHEHIYWDQASVLMQVGLLDPGLVPAKMRDKGVTELPVVGREAARRLVRGFDDEEEGEADNELIPGWYDDNDDVDDDERTGAGPARNGGGDRADGKSAATKQDGNAAKASSKSKGKQPEKTAGSTYQKATAVSDDGMSQSRHKTPIQQEYQSKSTQKINDDHQEDEKSKPESPAIAKEPPKQQEPKQEEHQSHTKPKTKVGDDHQHDEKSEPNSSATAGEAPKQQESSPEVSNDQSESNPKVNEDHHQGGEKSEPDSSAAASEGKEDKKEVDSTEEPDDSGPQEESTKPEDGHEKSGDEPQPPTSAQPADEEGQDLGSGERDEEKGGQGNN